MCVTGEIHGHRRLRELRVAGRDFESGAHGASYEKQGEFCGEQGRFRNRLRATFAIAARFWVGWESRVFSEVRKKEKASTCSYFPLVHCASVTRRLLYLSSFAGFHFRGTCKLTLRVWTGLYRSTMQVAASAFDGTVF